jgi:RHS repeat-associated protein
VPTGTTSHTYNTPKNRLLTAGADSFTYDDEGQLDTGYGTDYSFDYEHRLTGVGTTVQYSYDGIGNRLKAMRDGVTTYYIYDMNGNLIAEADGSKAITKYYIYGIGLMAMATPTDDVYCYHFNGTGSTIAITDMNKNMVNKYAYTPFGTLANKEENIPQPFKFVGQYGVMAEANGFYYMRARYYDPKVRRFISEDPIGFDGGDLNLYAYVGGSPVLRMDPSGKVWLRPDGAEPIFGFNGQEGFFGTSSPYMNALEHVPVLYQTAAFHDPTKDLLTTGYYGVDFVTNIATMVPCFAAALVYNVITTPVSIYDNLTSTTYINNTYENLTDIIDINNTNGITLK